MDNTVLYRDLFKTWQKVKPNSQDGKAFQNAVNEFWKINKATPNIIRAKIQALEAQHKKLVGSVASFFSVASTSSVNHASTAVSADKEKISISMSNEVGASNSTLVVPLSTQKQRSRPSQEKTTTEINNCRKTIDALQSLKDKNLLTTEQANHLKVQKILAKKLETKLSSLKRKAECETKYRKNKTLKLKQFADKHPEFESETVKLVPKSMGRPRIETEQPLLLKTIVDIVTPSSGADERRRTESLRTCMTLDDLHAALLAEGIQLSRSALYLRLLPKNASTIHGKRHIKTVPVRILRAQNSKRKDHADAHFAAATIKFLRDMVGIFGPKVVFALSQDDKARVPLGLPAAKIQAPILMNIKYRVMLPDHDWVVAGRHKLIPSVYAALDFKNDALTYSGPTYIGIRSGKHDSSTARTHSKDFKRLLEINSFKSIATIPETGIMKPIVVMLTDGASDENPRFPQTMLHAVEHFKENDLDCMFVATHAPGHSAFNPVERRMAALSHDLAGLILPHDHFGSHLDSQGRTTDIKLEQENFQKAGEILAEIWSETIIDDYDVIAEYLSPEDIPHPQMLSEEWKATHIRQSHYLLQIVKCLDEKCCNSWRTNYKDIFPSRFIPPPLLFHRSVSGVKACSQDCKETHKHFFGDLQMRMLLNNLEPTAHGFKMLPFDYFCPTQRELLMNFVCPLCGIYFPSQVALRHHKVLHKVQNRQINNDEQEVEDEVEEEIEEEYIGESFEEYEIINPDEEAHTPIIENWDEWIRCPFIEICDE